MKFVFKEADDWDFERAGVRGKVFPTFDLISSANFLLIETESGHSTTIVEEECDFTYYILDGSGMFKIDDQLFPAESGDIVVIPKGSAFSYDGKLRMFLISSPLWSEEQELSLIHI